MDSVHSSTGGRRRGAPPAGERLTRDAVLTAAAELIERDGQGFSLRSLAVTLGVRPAALYNHIRDRDELLDAVTERFLGGFTLAAANQPWPDWLATVARELRRHLLDRPELTSLMLARAPAIPAGPVLLQRFQRTLTDAGVPGPIAHLGWHAMLTTVIGTVQQDRASGRDQSATFEAVLAAAIRGVVAEADSPAKNTVALYRAHTKAHG